jgi:hypothetical protein
MRSSRWKSCTSKVYRVRHRFGSSSRNKAKIRSRRGRDQPARQGGCWKRRRERYYEKRLAYHVALPIGRYNRARSERVSAVALRAVLEAGYGKPFGRAEGDATSKEEELRRQRQAKEEGWEERGASRFDRHRIAGHRGFVESSRARPFGHAVSGRPAIGESGSDGVLGVFHEREGAERKEGPYTKLSATDLEDRYQEKGEKEEVEERTSLRRNFHSSVRDTWWHISRRTEGCR